MKTQLAGTYELISHGRFDSDGMSSSSGHQMSGQLMYSDDGFMSVFITFVNEPTEFSDMVIYSGRFSIDGNKIVHHIENSPNLKRRNTDEIRYFKFENNLLILLTPQTPEGFYEIKWQRRLHDSVGLKIITSQLNLKKEPLIDEIEYTLDLGRYIGWHDNSDFTDQLEALLKKIVRFAEANPIHGIEVFRIYIAACLEKSEEVDGSDGSLGTFFDNLMCEWAKACSVAKIAGSDFITELEHFKKVDSVGYLMDIEKQVIPGLGSDLSLSMEKYLKEKIGISNDNIEASSDKAITPNDDFIKYLKKLYTHTKNLKALTELSSKFGLTSADILSIAKIHFENGDLNESLNWIAKVREDNKDLFSTYDLEKLEQTILLQLGRQDEVIEKAWRRFEKSHSWFDLENILKVSSESKHPEYKMRAAEILKNADLDDAISGLFKIGEFALLNEKIMSADEKELQRLFYGESIRVADNLSETYPAAAVRIYLSQANRILEDKKSKAYHHALNYLSISRELMIKLGQKEEWQKFAEHFAVIHKRKSSFMSGFKEILSGNQKSYEPSFEEKIAKKLK